MLPVLFVTHSEPTHNSIKHEEGHEGQFLVPLFEILGKILNVTQSNNVAVFLC